MIKMIAFALAALLFISCGGSTASTKTDSDNAQNDQGQTGDTGNTNDTGSTNDKTNPSDIDSASGDGTVNPDNTQQDGDSAMPGDSDNNQGDGNVQPDADTHVGIKLCIMGCNNNPADCETGSPTKITDADNYTCGKGYCEYKGCNNTKECTDTYQSSNYGCNTDAGYTAPTCTLICTKVSDCYSSSSTVPAFDGDNYECTGSGFCKYKGCNTDKECVDTYKSTGKTYSCQKNGNTKYCQVYCSTAADCASTTPAYTADHYSCTDHQCVYKGCLSDKECQDSIGSTYKCMDF